MPRSHSPLHLFRRCDRLRRFAIMRLKLELEGMTLPERDIMEKHLEQTTAFREVLASRGVLVACVGAKLRSFAPTQ